MVSLAEDIRAQLSAWSSSEIIAVVFAILYLVLAIRENIWCWLFAGVSTMIYIGLYFDARLYMESALNVFYLGMALYGWWNWRRTDERQLPVQSWDTLLHLKALAIIAICVLVSGFTLERVTDAAFPFIDSATTFAAIWATFLIARKVLENWWYWLVIDVVSVVIYWSRGLELTSILFVVYVVMIPFGLLSWTRNFRRQTVSGTA